MAQGSGGGVMDFSDLIYRHLDRMSEMLKCGIDVGSIANAKMIMAYYLFLMHLHCLVSLRMSKEQSDKIEKYKREFPTFQLTQTGRPEDNIKFMEALGKWFQVLLIVANNEDYISINPKTMEGYDVEIAKVVEAENNNSESNKQ